MLKFLLSERVLNLVERLIGPDIALWSSHFIAMEPYIGRRTPSLEFDTKVKNDMLIRIIVRRGR